MNRGMDDSVISCDSLSRVYGRGRNSLTVLNRVSLSVARGEMVAIVGPSGAGKSTLLNIIGGLDSPSSGECTVLGSSIGAMSEDRLSLFRNRHLGFVFQLHHLLAEFSALENVMMPLLIRRESPKAAKRDAMEFLERFSLGDRASHLPGELSGGECQRVAVARALVSKPDILLADEPTGSLDSANSATLMDLLFSYGREQGTTIGIVTHDAAIASRCGRTVRLVDGEIRD